ncbi:hypothetical protein D3C78_1949070 [compost metagenome]
MTYAKFCAVTFASGAVVGNALNAPSSTNNTCALKFSGSSASAAGSVISTAARLSSSMCSKRSCG